MTSILLALLLSRGSAVRVDVLANVRNAVTAVSGTARWAETVLTGNANFRGVDAAYRLQFASGGRTIQRVDGTLGQTEGSDGKTFWEIDASGATRRLDFEDVDRSEAVLFLLTDYWLDPNAPVDLTVDPMPQPKTDAYTVHMKLRSSGLDESIQVDPKTWLPKSAEYVIAASKTTIRLSDWRAAGSIKAPFLATVKFEGLTDTYSVNSAVPAPEAQVDAYALPNLPLRDHSYNASAPAMIETKRASSGHILVHPRVNGKDIGWFILDSGADSMLIDRKAADSLSLPKIGRESVVGIGGAVQEPFRTAPEFSLGPATIRNVTFLEFDLAELSSFFKVPLAGIVGYDFFRRYVVQVNLKKPSVEVNELDPFRLDRGAWTKMRFSAGNPAVTASFEGDHTGWFRLDTGANGTVMFHSPTVTKFHLLDGRKTSASGMAGVGGSSDARMGTLAWFELGGHRFEKIPAVFSLAKVGAFADTYLAGNIGQDLLEPFTVVFDFANSRVAFLPH